MISKLGSLRKLPKKLRLVLAHCNSKNFFFKKCLFLMKNYHYLILSQTLTKSTISSAP